MIQSKHWLNATLSADYIQKLKEEIIAELSQLNNNSDTSDTPNVGCNMEGGIRQIFKWNVLPQVLFQDEECRDKSIGKQVGNILFYPFWNNQNSVSFRAESVTGETFVSYKGSINQTGWGTQTVRSGDFVQIFDTCKQTITGDPTAGYQQRGCIMTASGEYYYYHIYNIVFPEKCLVILDITSHTAPEIIYANEQ